MRDQKGSKRKHGAKALLNRLLIGPWEKQAVWVSPGRNKTILSFEMKRGSYHWITKSERCAVIGG